MDKIWTLFAGMAAAFLPLGSAQAVPTYVVTDLGSSLGQSFASSVNNRGQVAANSVNGSQSQSFIYSNGIIDNIGMPGPNRYANDINDSGVVVGTTTNSDGKQLAYVYSGGAITTLGTLGGASSVGIGINNSGKATGHSATSGNMQHAFLWSDGKLSDLGTLGGTTSYGRAINNNGQVVGFSSTASGYGHAFLYEKGLMKDLGTWGASSSAAYGLNDSGQIVGELNYVNGGYFGFLYSNGTIRNLGTLGGTASSASSINSSGQVVGYSFTSGNLSQAAFLYDSGLMLNLNSLIASSDPLYGSLSLISASSINDGGMISAYGRASDGTIHAVLLTPELPAITVAEPVSLALFGTGLFGASVIRRRRAV